MPPEKGPKENLGTAKKPKQKTNFEKKEGTPATNEDARKAAKKAAEAAKKKGKGRVESAKKAAEKKEKPRIVQLVICGRQIERRIIDGKPVFVEKGNATPISDLSSWVEKQMQDKELQQQIDANLKPYTSQIRQLDEKKRNDVVKKLNDTKFTKVEYGKIDIYGKEVDDPVKKAAYLVSIVAKKTSPRSLTIQKSELDKIKHKPYLDYQHILPANVRTILINRDGKKFVCSRALGSPENGGRVSYVDVVTGKRFYLKGGDKIQIVGTVSSSATLSMQKAEQTYAEVRSKAGKTYLKDSDKVVKFNTSPVSTGGGSSSVGHSGYSVGGGGGYSGGGAPSYSPSSGSSAASAGVNYPSTAPNRLAPTVSSSITQTPEEMKQYCTQETFKLPGNHMFASMLSPNLEKYPKLKKSKPRLIMYFAGRGYYNTITKWVRQHGRKQEPPPEVLAQAAREDFLSSKKRIFAMLKSRWAKGENVHFALITHMRNYFSSDDKESGKAGHWYKELWSPASAKALIGAVTARYKAKSGAKEVKRITVVGHSMGGKAVAGISKLDAKGQLPYEFSYFSFDASYWYLNLEKVKKDPKVALYLSFRPGSKTEKVAQSIISGLKLKGNRRGEEVVYTTPQYPNVRVVASSVSHGAQPGAYLNPAWELAQRAQAGKLSTKKDNA